jgi:hypothetical protein
LSPLGTQAVSRHYVLAQDDDEYDDDDDDDDDEGKEECGVVSEKLKLRRETEVL